MWATLFQAAGSAVGGSSGGSSGNASASGQYQSTATASVSTPVSTDVSSLSGQNWNLGSLGIGNTTSSVPSWFWYVAAGLAALVVLKKFK